MSLPPGVDDSPGRAGPGDGEEPKRNAQPYGSIIERFRGTRWDPSRDLPPPPSRDPVSPLMLMVAVVALVVVGVFTLAAVLGRPQAEAPTPSRFIATPQPTPGPDDLLLAAFWREVNGPTFGYQLDMSASLTQGTDVITEHVALDVSVDDFRGTADLEAKGIIQPAHLILLRHAGVLYLRSRPSDPWQNAITAGQIELHARPFLGLDDQRQLIVSGTATRAGVTYQRLVSTELYRAQLKQLLPIALGSLPPGGTTLEVLVTDDGKPVEATITVRVPANPANGQLPIEGKATYVFTKVDAIDPIPAPSL